MNNMQPSPLPGSPRMGLPLAAFSSGNAQEKTIDVLPSCLLADSDFVLTRARGRINWNIVAGAVLALLVSGAGWAGVAVLIARLWKVG